MKSILLCLGLVIGINDTYSQKSEFQLIYHLVNESEESGAGELIEPESLPGPTSDTTRILLQNKGSFKTSFKEGIFTHYDLENELISKYGPDTLYDIVPLYSVIDYRIAEYKNRTFLTEILQAGGLEDAMGDLANLETLFRIEIVGKKVRKSLKIKTFKDTVIYSFKNSEFVKVHYSKKPIPNDNLDAFAKFLLYRTEIHPSIGEAIVKTKFVPDYISYTYTNVGVKNIVTYYLLESSLVEREPGNLDKTKREFAQRETSQMGSIIDSMMIQTYLNAVEPVDSNVYFSRANELSEAGEHTSGVLCLLEYLLSTGIQPIHHIKKIGAFQDTDSSLAVFFSCLNRPRSREEAELKISKLNSLINNGLDYGYVMNIFAANYIEPIDPSEAVTYFYKALSHNPYITGAWLDLGKIYANRYDYDSAWKCFEIMLKIKSDHPMAQEVIERKSSLKKNYPKYFKTD